MTRRVTTKQFKILVLLRDHPKARIPNSYWLTVNIYASREMDRSLGKVQKRTIKSMVESELLVEDDSQWYKINPRVMNLDVSRHWVTIAA